MRHIPISRTFLFVKIRSPRAHDKSLAQCNHRNNEARERREGCNRAYFHIPGAITLLLLLISAHCATRRSYWPLLRKTFSKSFTVLSFADSLCARALRFGQQSLDVALFSSRVYAQTTALLLFRCSSFFCRRLIRGLCTVTAHRCSS